MGTPIPVNPAPDSGVANLEGFEGRITTVGDPTDASGLRDIAHDLGGNALPGCKKRNPRWIRAELLSTHLAHGISQPHSSPRRKVGGTRRATSMWVVSSQNSGSSSSTPSTPVLGSQRVSLRGSQA